MYCKNGLHAMAKAQEGMERERTVPKKRGKEMERECERA